MAIHESSFDSYSKELLIELPGNSDILIIIN